MRTRLFGLTVGASLTAAHVAYAEPLATDATKQDIDALRLENDELRARLDRLERAAGLDGHGATPSGGLERAPDAEHPGDLAAPAEASPPLIAPTLLAEVDYRVFPSDIEGNTGFALARLRPGVVVAPANWFRGVATIEFAGENPTILDAYARMRAAPWVAFTVGYSKPPLFPSFALEAEHATPFPDAAPVVSTFRIRRDLGADVRFTPKEIPLEGTLRIGNGTGSALGNDNALPAGYAAIDLVLGRAWVGAARDARAFGLRVGAAGFYENANDRDGLHGATPLGFVYARPIVVSGVRAVAEAHVVGYAGPVRLIVEGALAHEERSKDDDGNRDTPRVPQDALDSFGLTAELSWVVLGRPREVGHGPALARNRDGSWAGGAFEIAARYDGLFLNRGASDVTPVGSQGGGLVAKWTPVEFLQTSVSGFITHYDVSPIEEPEQRWSPGLLSRIGFFWELAGPAQPKPPSP